MSEITKDELVEILAKKGLYAKITRAELEEREHPETMDIEAAPDIAGASKADRSKGLKVTQKPYDQRCKVGHYVPSGATVFTDDRENYCPYCGKTLDIA